MQAKRSRVSSSSGYCHGIDIESKQRASLFDLQHVQPDYSASRSELSDSQRLAG